jgi:hypothetical protein
MKAYQSLLITVLLPGAFALAQVPAPVPATAPAAADAMIQAVRTAPDPSATVEAYTRAIAAAGPAAAMEVKQAFVRRMLELGTPELADSQARDLVSLGVADAGIRGVAAFNDALRGNAQAAIDNLNRALSERPNDLFLLATAGQVVAWYDSQGGRSTLSKQDVAGVASLRLRGKGRAQFENAYRGATQAWQAQTAAGSQAGSSTVSRASSPNASPTTQRSYIDSCSGAATSGTSYDCYYPSSSSYYGYGYYQPYYGYGTYYSPYGYSGGFGASYSASARFGDSFQDRQAQRAAGAGVVAGAVGNSRSMFPLAVNPGEARAAQGNVAGAGSMLRPPPHPGTGQPPQAPAAGAQAPPPQAGAAAPAAKAPPPSPAPARPQPARPSGPPPAPPRPPGPPPGPPHP